MTASHLSIITGASRGMGRAIAAQSMRPGQVVLAISRRTDASLAAAAQAAGATLIQWEQDLADPVGAAARLAAWLEGQDGTLFESVTLINNAGVLAEPAPLSAADASQVSNALRVGLEAPMLLCAAFLRATRGWPGARRVLNISSGLGRHAMGSQSAYCAAKAGMDHFTRCLALEEEAAPNGARVVSLAPGVIDTDMQVQLRGSDPELFPGRSRFMALKADGVLDSPDAAATKVLAYLARPDFGSQPVADVRDA